MFSPKKNKKREREAFELMDMLMKPIGGTMYIISSDHIVL